MTEFEAALARMMSILDQAIASAEEAARRELVAARDCTDETRAYLQGEADLASMEWHAKRPSAGDDPDEILGCFITVDHGHGEMFVAGFEPFERDTCYQLYNQLTLVVAPGSWLKFRDVTAGYGTVQCSVSGHRDFL